jgi:uncharacterized protein YbjT (DUF2867 family)
MTVLVTGSTGNVGAQAVRRLAELGEPVRAFVRDEARARALLGGAVELAVGEFADPESIVRALRGVDRILVSSADGPEKVRHESAVIESAADAGVHLVVKASTLRAEVGSSLPPFDWHGEIEERLRASGIPFVLLRSCFYMTNLLAAAQPIREQGVLPAPAGDGAVAMIDPRDTGDVAAAVLTAPGHEGHIYDLTGPEALTYAQVAAELSAATGRTVRHIDLPDDDFRQGLEAAGLPDWLVRHLTGLFPLVRDGALAATTDAVHALTGRSPRTLAEFAREHAGLFGARDPRPA